MCRNIKTLHNFDPPATDEEIRASALQFVRKLSGCSQPSNANTEAFERAVEKVTADLRFRSGARTYHFLKCPVVFRPTVRISRTVLFHRADIDRARAAGFHPAHRYRKEMRVAEWHIGYGNFAAA